MNATRTTLPMRADQPACKGFAALPCILCGNADGNITVSLDDVSRFHCVECGEAFDADAVRRHLALWQAVLAWCYAALVITE